MLSIIIPTLNEANSIVTALNRLELMRRQGNEIIVADGGSTDDTWALAQPRCDRIVAAPRGRASQMNAGAALARGDILLFLHADTLLPRNAGELVRRVLAEPAHAWGRFDIRIDSSDPKLRLVGKLINARSRWTGIATGDQAIFVRRADFERVGRYPDIALMEDVALSRALKWLTPPVCLTDRVVTSGRRWEKHVVVRTILLMWRLRLAYALGADPTKLALRYGYAPRRDA